MPKLDESLAKIDAWLKVTEAQRDSTSVTQRTLNLMTFGLGLGAATAGVYGAHRDTIMGFGLGAGTSYTAGALFVPADQTTLYNTAMKSLVCIRTKASALHAAVDSAEKRRTGDLRRSYLEEQMDPKPCDPPPALKTAFQSAERARARAVAALDAARAADSSAGDKTSDAAANVIVALNEELTKRAASAEAVLGAGKSIFGIAAGIAASPAAPPPDSDKEVSPAERSLDRGPLCRAPSVEEVNALEATYKATEATINSALNAVAALDTACVFVAAAISPLIISQEEITLATDGSYVLTISGGRPPYSAQWVNTQPTGVSHQVVSPGSIVLSAGASAKSGSEYKLEVSDSSLVPYKKPIKVKVK
jgi:hypothetical protein